MVPRQDIVCLYTEDTMSQHMQTIRQSRHTRYPLCEDDKDHVLGLVHIKDIMDLYIHKRSNLNLIKRPILMVPEIMPASKLLQLMRTRRTYLAMVVDEYGSTVGSSAWKISWKNWSARSRTNTPRKKKKSSPCRTAPMNLPARSYWKM